MLVAETWRGAVRLFTDYGRAGIGESRNECLALARNQPPYLIVMDLSMPVLDGWGVFEELKADQRTRTIPCMAVTAHAELGRNRALETGFSAYVSKPFSGEALLKTIATVLAKQQAG